MINPQTLTHNLTTLNQIAETLNQSVDMNVSLNAALAQLIELTSLETGWIFVKDRTSQNRWAGRGYTLAAHYNLPPAMSLGEAKAWRGECQCQILCNNNRLNEPYTEVRCSRLAGSKGNRKGLAVHASTLLRSGERVLGILNVAAPSWQTFTPESLAMLAHVGSLMGIAIDRARLYDMLQEQRIHEQATLLDFSNQLLSRHELTDLMNYLVEEMRRVLEADACALILPSDTPGLLAYKASSGWRDNPVARQRQVPADATSTSGLVMQQQRPLLVEDLIVNDPTSWNSEWISAEEFRGHAAVPLVADGRAIGTLIINTRTPRLFTEDELRFIRLMANQAALALEKARFHHEEMKHQRMEEELAVGWQIQRSLLPDTAPAIPGWEFAASYQPARLVGGDFFDFFELPRQSRQLGVVIADVAGKGVPAALFMSMSRSIIRTKALSGCNPATALKRSNRLIFKDSRSSLFLTAFYALINVETGQLTYARAGHDLPLWLHRTAPTETNASVELKALASEGIILGVFEEVELEERTIQLELGDILVLYTDGVTEAMNDSDELFGSQRLYDLIKGNHQASASEMIQIIIDAVNQFIGETPQADDFTLVVVKRVAKTKEA